MVKAMRKRIGLNFDWYFSVFKDTYINDYKTIEKFTKIDIPHNMVDLSFNYNNPHDLQIVGLYRKTINILEEYKGKILMLVFSGVAHKAQIFINGNYVTTHFGGYDEFKVDISEFVNYGEENYLSVVVSSKEDEKIPPFGGKLDFLGYGGIYREVSFEIINPDYIKDAYLRLVDFSKKTLGLSLYTTKNAGLIKLKLTSNNTNYEKEFEITDTANNYLFDFEDIEFWDIDNPILYNVELKYYINDELVDEVSFKTGFRDLKFTKKGFFLNGKQIKLIGLNRHQTYPYVGYAMPKSVQEKDAEILKYDLGVNIVRTSHYMQSSHFLNRCDEIGLLVFPEIPGWNHIGDKEFRNHTINNVKAMINRDYHHPSIIMWGVRINESLDDDLYIETNRLAKRLDISRPTAGVRNFKGSTLYEDIYTYNDFLDSSEKRILTKPKKVIKNAPYLVSEHTGHLYPTKITDKEEILINQALRHYNIINASLKQNDLLGVIGWSFVDYNTNFGFGSEDLISYHGVMDMFRLPKYAASIYKLLSNQEPFIDVLSSLKPGEYNSRYIDHIYVAANVEYIKLFRDNKLVGTFYPEKKSNFKYPLIKINDFLGDILVREEGITKFSNKLLKSILPKVYKQGLNLSFFDKLKLLYVLRRNKLTLNDLEKMFYKYSTLDATFRFEGVIKGVVAVTKTISSFKKANYEIMLDKDSLVHSDTYDATRIVIKKVDQDGNVLRYANDVVKVEVNKNLEVLGKKSFSLLGGVAAFWVRSKANNCIGEVKIKIGNEEFEKNIKIK